MRVSPSDNVRYRYKPNGWIQSLVTIAIAALTAYVGLRVGLAESKVKQAETDRRLDRMESKIDWLVRWEMDQHNRGGFDGN